MTKKSKNIIQRRELDPLFMRARKLVRHYETAAECPVSLLGPDWNKGKSLAHPRIPLFCAICKRFYNNPGRPLDSEEYPCTAMHADSVQVSRRLRGSYIYMCQVGFIFWTSPIYSGERFAGALLSSGVLGVERRQAVENIFLTSGGEIPREKIALALERIPKKTPDEVKALAQMMLICAEQLTEGKSETNNPPDISLPFRRARRGEPPRACENAYSLDRERSLLANLRRGDHEKARAILKELLGALLASSGGNFEIFRMRALELAVLLSREAVNGKNAEAGNILEINSRYLKKIEDAQSADGVSEILNIIIDRISGKIFSFRGISHSAALRKAERFIWENYTRKISLQEIAAVSGLSAPYFSTVFKEEMGENLSGYLNRLRVEKASAMLTEMVLPIRKIAEACGFEDQSWFSKIFKNHTGFSPGKYRKQGYVPHD
jgi:AraC-like DNA-binding protein/ligand-binding sensor protein